MSGSLRALRAVPKLLALPPSLALAERLARLATLLDEAFDSQVALWAGEPSPSAPCGCAGLDADSARALAEELRARGREGAPGELLRPLLVDGRAIGTALIRSRAEPPADASLDAALAAAAAALAPHVDGAGDGPGLELSVLQRVAATLGPCLDLPRVLESCLDLAVELMGADVSAIHTLDERGTVLEMAARRDVLPDLAAAVERLGSPFVERVRARGTAPYVVAAASLPEPLRPPLAAAGVVMTVSAPLVTDGNLVGVHSLGFYRPRAFSAETMATLRAIAEQEAAAIDRARAHADAERRARLADALREVAERSLAQPASGSPWDPILDGATRIGRSPMVRLALLDEGGTLRTAAVRHVPDNVALAGVPFDDPYLRWMQSMDGPRVIEDFDEIPAGSLLRGAAEQLGLRSVAVIPLRLHGRFIGYVSSLSMERRRFGAAEVNAMRLLGSLAASIVEAERLRREAAIERARIGEVIDRLPMPVAVMDEQGRIEQVNAAFAEYNEHAVRGAFYAEAIRHVELRRADGSPAEQEDLIVPRALAAEEPLPSEVRVRTRSGWRSVVSHAAALRDANGNPDGAVLALQDVTALRDVADAKDRFLDIASHELRSPLGSLRACASLLDLDPAAAEDGERRRSLTQRIVHQVDRLARIVDDLFDMAQLRSGNLTLRRERVDLVELAREAAELSQLDAPRHAVRVEAREPVPGEWDRARLAQVLSNLVGNAVRYSPDGGEIVIAVREDGDCALLSVRDQGIGIPPALQRQLFEPYRRGREAGDLARGGLGLGLYITLEIVRRHGGRIEVESELGRGSRFTVVLPLAPPPEPTRRK